MQEVGWRHPHLSRSEEWLLALACADEEVWRTEGEREGGRRGGREGDG